MQKFNLIDVWRFNNPNMKASTWSNRSATRRSRLDYWLVSDHLNIGKISVNIITTPLTDHNAVSILIPLQSAPSTKCRNAYWKLNSSLLQHEMVKADIRKIILEFWNKAKSEDAFGSNWELLIFKTGQYLRKYGSNLSNDRKSEQEKVVSNIISLYQKDPTDISEEERLTLILEQLKLNEIYSNKAKGAFIRSRKRWIEEGEQNSAYFFGLEKYQGKFNLIQQFNINDTVTDNPKSIAVFCSDFYRNVYKSKYCHQSTTTFLNSLIVTPISQDDRKFCDDPITVQEITFAIEHCKTNKSPGVDGLSAEFYQAFTQDPAPFLLEVILEC